MSLSESPDQEPKLDSYKSLNPLGEIEKTELGSIVMVKLDCAERLQLDPDYPFVVYRVDKEEGKIWLVGKGFPNPNSYQIKDFKLYTTSEFPIIDINSEKREINEKVGAVLARRIKPSQEDPNNPELGLFRDVNGTLYRRFQSRWGIVTEGFSRGHHRNLGHMIGPMTDI